MNEKQDFSEEFIAQRVKMRPWAILIALVFLAIIVVLPLLFFTIGLSTTFFTIYVTVSAALLIIALPSVIKLSRCPSCKKYMGRDISKFCPVCGVKISA